METSGICTFSGREFFSNFKKVIEKKYNELIKL